MYRVTTRYFKKFDAVRVRLHYRVGKNLYPYFPHLCGPGSSVDIANDYVLDDPGSNPGGDEIFRPSRQALEPTQPPVKLFPGSFPGVKCGRGVLLTTHPLLVPRSWKSRAIPLPTIWATTGLKRDHFTFFTFHIYCPIWEKFGVTDTHICCSASVSFVSIGAW